MDRIKCPHCGKDVELSEAIIHELSEQVRVEESQKLKEQFEKEKAKEQAEAEKRLRQEFEIANKEASLELVEAKKREQALEDKLAKEEKEREGLEEKIRENAKKEALKQVEAANKEIFEKQRLEKLELQKQLDDARKANDDLNRKLNQKSQQLQGEVLEVDFEERLRRLFPNDQFEPIPKGVEGGDIWQKIIYQGRVVGTILWETKRTKAWSNSWSKKLKDDGAKISATEVIIVSNALPNGISSFDRKDGVWITSYEHALTVCRLVRFFLTRENRLKATSSQTEEEWEKIREYILSDNFKNRMQAHYDIVRELRDSLDSEKRATILRWKKAETQIEKLDSNTTNFYGELRSIVSGIPRISGVEAPLLGQSDGEENQTLF